MTEAERLRLSLNTAMGIAQRLRLLHEKVPGAVKPFEVGNVIAELDAFVAALPPEDKFPAIALKGEG